MKFPVPDQWDLETGLAVIGSVIGGLSAAITAKEYGVDAVVLERSALVGGDENPTSARANCYRAPLPCPPAPAIGAGKGGAPGPMLARYFITAARSAARRSPANAILLPGMARAGDIR